MRLPFWTGTRDAPSHVFRGCHGLGVEEHRSDLRLSHDRAAKNTWSFPGLSPPGVGAVGLVIARRVTAHDTEAGRLLRLRVEDWKQNSG
jgi:hypothetical protein